MLLLQNLLLFRCLRRVLLGPLLLRDRLLLGCRRHESWMLWWLSLLTRWSVHGRSRMQVLLNVVLRTCLKQKLSDLRIRHGGRFLMPTSFIRSVCRCIGGRRPMPSRIQRDTVRLVSGRDENFLNLSIVVGLRGADFG